MKGSSGRKPYSRYLDAKGLPTPNGKYSPDALLEMQQAMLDALCSDDQLPAEMQRDLAFSFEYLCAGFTFDLLKPINRSGGSKPPIAKYLQAAAIRYLRWVEDGHISDPRPIATIAEAYQVAERTVRGWRKAWRDRPTPSLDDAFGAEHVTGFMKGAGKQYPRFIPKEKSKGI